MLRKWVFLLVVLLAQPVFAGEVEHQALALVNAARAQAGCPALQPEPHMEAAALAHAKDMAMNDYFGHEGTDGSHFTARVRRAGLNMGAGAENIAAGYKDPQKVVSIWLGSPGHLRNMMNCRYKRTGLAVYYQADDKPMQGNSYAYKYYWVQVFAK